MSHVISCNPENYIMYNFINHSNSCFSITKISKFKKKNACKITALQAFKRFRTKCLLDYYTYRTITKYSNFVNIQTILSAHFNQENKCFLITCNCSKKFKSNTMQQW
ncbi:hypothetical protein EGW08_002305 [Elysia chlorotica]|uniref:Uncharacterized protein n=1 Tax=Elysia chlorotica TaxID=188477 RepID=A0A433U809_ELYCH|nr:hypothetical protein EGW08_002305 [Elysia chlorotica]